MFDPDVIRRAVALSQLGHELVQWLGDVVAGGGLSFGRAHGTMSVQTAARDWIEHNLSTLPARCRPDDADVPAFANLVSTYFLTSFELTPPGQKRMRSDGCWCNWCTWAAPRRRCHGRGGHRPDSTQYLISRLRTPRCARDSDRSARSVTTQASFRDMPPDRLPAICQACPRAT